MNPSASQWPTSLPSESPSISTSPSSSPSANPSVSTSPSSQPSMNPSLSGQPSSIPSESPSVSGMPSSQPSMSPSSVPSSPAPTSAVDYNCDIGFGSFINTLTPQPGVCIPSSNPNNPDVCCMDSRNQEIDVTCENGCPNCGAGPTEASCCINANSNPCTPGTNEYCCKTSNGGGYACRAFGTSCGSSGGQSVEYAVDENSGQICLLTEAFGSDPNLVCSPP